MQNTFKALPSTSRKREREEDSGTPWSAAPPLPEEDLEIKITSKAAKPIMTCTRRRAMLEGQDNNHRFTTSTLSSVNSHRQPHAASSPG